MELTKADIIVLVLALGDREEMLYREREDTPSDWKEERDDNRKNTKSVEAVRAKLVAEYNKRTAG